jgi:hypothetical protein
VSGVVQDVAVQADWLTYVTAGSTVGAALLAVASILYSSHQAKRSQQVLLRERRADFELGLLAELAKQMDLTGLSHINVYVRILAALAGPDDLPVLRGHFGHNPPPGAIELANGLDSHGLAEAGRREINEAIARRLTTP